MSSDKNGKELGVYIPVPPAKIAEFLGGLLGRPQVIRGGRRGSICIEMKDIENFYHLIDQRVNEQNIANLVAFDCNIQYQDGSSVEIHSLKSLREYASVGSSIPIGVQLSWVFLVQFKSVPVPERQEIDVLMRCNSGKQQSIDDDLVIDEMVESFWHGRNMYSGAISFYIAHTRRSWGFDIQNLLSSHIENMMSVSDEPLREFFRKNRKLTEFLFAVPLGMAGGLFFLQVIDWLVLQSYRRYLAIEGTEFADILIKKMNFIALDLQGKNILSLFVAAGGLFLLTSVLIAMILIFIIKPALQGKPSFILLSDSAKKDFDVRMTRYNKGWTNFLFGAALSIVLGVLGNTVFHLLSK